MQLDDNTPPIVVEYVPETQLTQLDDPPLGWYKPGMQLLQYETDVAPIFVEAVPAIQLLQLELMVTPVLVEYVPAGQLMQTAEPVLAT